MQADSPQLISLRVDYSSKANALAGQQRESMRLDYEFRSLKACVDAAADETQALLCWKAP